VKRVDSADPRSFADVETLGKQLTDLLDTRASVSMLGKGCRELGVTVQPYFSVVRTACGEDRFIIGRLELPVKYKGVSKPVKFYLFPYLEQSPYFGVDYDPDAPLSRTIACNIDCNCKGVVTGKSAE